MNRLLRFKRGNHAAEIGQWFVRPVQSSLPPIYRLLAALLVAMAGCTTKPPEPARVQRVNVPVAVACQEPVPDKPPLPIDSLTPGSDLDTAVKAALASIDRLTGYTGQLETALANCRAPISQTTTYGLSGQFPQEQSK